MNDLSELFFTISAATYLNSTIVYIIYAILKKDAFGKAGTWLLAVGLSSQTVALILRTIKIGHAPFVTMYETLVFWSWLIALVYLLLQFKFRIRAFGALVTPMAFLAIAVASMLPESYKEATPLVPALQSRWLEFHIITCFIAYACFAISFAVAIAYLLKRSNRSQDLLSKDKLDMIGFKSISFGLPFLTIGIISGSIWANVAWGAYWSNDPKEISAAVTWIIYIIYLHLRLIAKWKGRSCAITSIIGFVAVMFTFLGVNFLLPGLHSYL